MSTSTLAAFFEASRTPIAMCGAGVVIFLVALWVARTDLAQAPGLDKVIALGNLSFAVPLAVFGALHVVDVQFVLGGVPSYMPFRLFWAYFFGFAQLAAALSIAAKIQARWSGLLVGLMFVLFVAMLDFPGALAEPKDRFGWTFLLRETAFASGGWLIAVSAMPERYSSKLISRGLVPVGRVLIGVVALFYGVQHFLHPIARPGVPLQALMPEWIPARPLIGYLTGAMLVVAGAFILLNKKTRLAATCLGGWILLLVVFIYGPILVWSLADPSIGTKIEGINYFADTLLFGGAILALASATPRTD
jgi:uncharacterized membrane protein